MTDAYTARAVARMFPGTVGGQSRIATPVPRALVVPQTRLCVATGFEIAWFNNGGETSFEWTVPSNIEPPPVDVGAPVGGVILVKTGGGPTVTAGPLVLTQGGFVNGWLNASAGQVVTGRVGTYPLLTSLEVGGWPNGGNGVEGEGSGGAGSTDVYLDGVLMFVAGGAGGYVPGPIEGGPGGTPDGADGDAGSGTLGTGGLSGAGFAAGGDGTAGGGGGDGPGSGSSGEAGGGGGGSSADGSVIDANYSNTGNGNSVVIEYWVCL